MTGGHYHHLRARRIGLNELSEWGMDAKGYFSHHERRFFRMVGLNIGAASREVSHWDQPIIENASPWHNRPAGSRAGGVRECLDAGSF